MVRKSRLSFKNSINNWTLFCLRWMPRSSLSVLCLFLLFCLSKYYIPPTTSYLSLLFSCSDMSDYATPRMAGYQASLSFTIPWSLLKLMFIELWCHPSISTSVIPFSSCLLYFPASGAFPMSQHFAWGSQIIGVSASASVLPMNTQDWSPLGWTGWISLQSKGLSRVFSNTTVQKHQFFDVQLSSQSNSHIHKWPLEKP